MRPARLAQCPTCGRPTRSRSPEGARAFPSAVDRGKGSTCRACWEREKRRQDAPSVRPYNRHDDVLDEYAFLTTGTALRRAEVASRLLMSLAALDKHLAKARDRNDPRARKVIPR